MAGCPIKAKKIATKIKIKNPDYYYRPMRDLESRKWRRFALMPWVSVDSYWLGRPLYSTKKIYELALDEWEAYLNNHEAPLIDRETLIHFAGDELNAFRDERGFLNTDQMTNRAAIDRLGEIVEVDGFLAMRLDAWLDPTTGERRLAVRSQLYLLDKKRVIQERSVQVDDVEVFLDQTIHKWLFPQLFRPIPYWD